MGGGSAERDIDPQVIHLPINLSLTLCLNHSPSPHISPRAMNRVKQEGPTPSPSPSPAPQGGYTDFLLRSSAPSSKTGWRHNLMKFAALGDRIVDPNGEPFVQPVKLNRKDPRTVRRLTEEERESFNKAAIAAAAGVDAMDVDEALVKDENGVVKPVKKIREEIDLSLVGTGKSGLAPAVRTKSNMFKKKTKRVFVSSEEARRLKREEWMPWVLEDVHGNERWIGKLEGGAGEASAKASGLDGAATAASKRAAADKNGTGMKGWRPDAPTGGESGGGGSSYVAFVFGENGDDFKVVPVNRWYKFSRGPRYATLGTEEAEDEVRLTLTRLSTINLLILFSHSQYNRQQKAQDAEGRWMMHKRTTVASQKVIAANPASGASTPVPSSSKPAKPLSKAAKAAAAAAPAPPANIRSRLLDKSVLSGRRTSTGAGGARKKLRSVIKGTSGGNDDDELSGRRGKEEGGEQGDDEFEYDEDFQDDEEGVAKVNDMADEDETKELEVRPFTLFPSLSVSVGADSRFAACQNRIKKEMRSAKGFEEVVDDPDDEEEEELTNTGKAVKKLVKKLAKNQAYESDGEDDDNPYASAVRSIPLPTWCPFASLTV